jgi:glycosyltransferase involved in cell wall biosynthesis
MPKILFFSNTSWFLYNFHLHLAQTLRDQGNEIVLLAPCDEYSPRLEHEGFRWVDIRLSRRGMNLLKEGKSLFKLYQVYRQERPEIVHHFTVKSVLYGTMIARLLGIRRIVNGISGLGYLFIDQGLVAQTLRRLLMFVYRGLLEQTTVIFENRDDQEFFRKMGLVNPGKDFLVIGTGVDTIKFNFVPESNDIPIIVLPARLLWDKGVGEFVIAARQLKREGIQARFVLVGNIDLGNPSAVPETQLDEWIREGVIEWWGWQEDMPLVLAQTHIVCLPSYREGVPKALLEAASIGRPIVASDVPGCREVINDGINGFLVPPKEPGQLAIALRKLISDSTLRGKMGASSRKLAVERFDRRHITEQILAIYQSMSLPIR